MKPIINFIKHGKDIPLQNVNEFNLKKSRNPFYYFFFFRKVKQCNVLHYHYTKSLFLNRLFNLALYFVAKFPHGPAMVILVEDHIAAKKNYLDILLYKHSDIIEVYSLESKNKLIKNYNLPEKKITVLDKNMSNIKDDHKKAFFMNECGHPSWIYNQRNQRERINWLKQKSTGKKLEIGCATGYITNYIGGGVGVDLDKDRLQLAASKYKNSRFVFADASIMPFKNKEFDTVLIPESLEHVPLEKAKEIIKECIRVGKKLLITIPNASKPNYDKNLVENPEHLWLPTYEKMFELFGKDIKIEHTRKKDFMLVTKLC